MITQEEIIRGIDECIRKTSSTRKKTVGLPALKSDILKIQRDKIGDMILLLESAVLEPGPVERKPPDNACKYWVNRHSWSLSRTSDKKTHSRIVLDNMIVSYYKKNPLSAPPPTSPCYIDHNVRITQVAIEKMRRASRRADGEICLLGHGETTHAGNLITIPPGTWVKFYTPNLAFLRDVDTRAIAVPQVWGRHIRPKVQEVAGPGAKIWDHKWGQCHPDGMWGNVAERDVGGTWIQDVAKFRTLSSVLLPNMGNVHFVACRAHPNDDHIAFNAGHGLNQAGPEERDLKEEAVNRLAKHGGAPILSDYLPLKKCKEGINCWCRKLP
ncbi:MAG: hypothetical protein A4E72_01951 [Syntrophus sp. PtaU1.Bin208]|nr:MAG: hypothetical protein A4E72_01951 [Syntrophus sp. PtaU1.Bin208]